MRMPQYDVRNDGIGPYAVFHCEKCSREYRSKPDIGGTIAQDLGRRAVGDVLRGIPIFGRTVAESVTGQDPRYTYSLTPQQLDAAWAQVQEHFRECPTCLLVVCLADFDVQSGYCNDDSPRRAEIAEAQGEQGAAVVKGIAEAFGIGDAFRAAGSAMKAATANMARCPNDGTLAPAGTKFCSECGAAMIQPTADVCPQCGAPAQGARFCASCGAKIERAEPAPTTCPSCRAELKAGMRFCSECGTKVG